MHIYMIECKGNGKKYIGSSINVDRRLIDHKNELKRGVHKNEYLQSSWKKYGEESFCFLIVEEVVGEYDKTLLENCEDHWIDHYNSIEAGFNMMTARHNIPSQEIKDKISKTLTGKKLSKAHRTAISDGHKGNTLSSETRSKISESKKGTKFSEEHKKKLSAWQKGRTLPEEHIAKIAKGNLGKVRTDEHKENYRLSKLGKNNPQYGKVQPRVKCPHCSKVGGNIAMKGYHFDKCKKKPDQD